MTQIDEKALDVAVESLRPLFREPVTYLEQAARDSIAAYIAALPPPAGEVGEIAEALRKKAFCGPTMEAVHLRTIEWRAADALQSLSARLAEAERERDEARNAAVESSGIAGEACIKAQAATARAERAESALREIEMLRYGDETFLTDANKAHNIARAALYPAPAGGDDGWRDIASAPKDGTRILVSRKYDAYDHDLIGIDHWRDGGWFSRLQMQPTHWRPLPASLAKGARDE